MVIKDLKQTCAPCHGSGRQAGVSQWGITQINPAGRCLACGGRGFVLTPLGQEVIDLLGPYIKDMIESALDTAGKPNAKSPKTSPGQPD